MKRHAFVLLMSCTVCWGVAGTLTDVRAAAVASAEKGAEAVVLRNVAAKDGEVSGDVVNASGRTLRDVQLLIRHTWLWRDEFHPGKDDPGRAVYYTAQQEIPPGQSVRFIYKPSPPLLARDDGYFETTVAIAGFTEIYQ